LIGDFAEQGCVTERLENVAGDGRPGGDLLIDEVLAIGDGPDRPDELLGRASSRTWAAAPAWMAANSSSSLLR